MNPERFQTLFRMLLLATVLLLPAAAQAQSELFTPYKLEIVVHVAENRLLTDVFRGRIERELHDGFQAALGEMGHVTVKHEHPRLAEVLARGLRSLDDWKDRDDKKTHFVLIDYSGVHYEIQTRQYDGTVGRASPVVRHDRTRDRDFVAKAAALLLKHDFGVLGTVLTDEEGAKNQVKIELRGGGLGDMSRWVKTDDVFALAPPSGGSPLALRWSLLQVEQALTEEARDGVCVCRFFHRYRLSSIAGYRCIKLGTVRTPLRLRFGQKMANGRFKPLNERLDVDIRRHGFEGEETTKLRKQSDLRAGTLDTVRDKDGVFENVAFVEVVSGIDEKTKPRVPIALVDDQPILIEMTPAKDFDALFTLRKTRWKSEADSSLQTQAHLFRRLGALGASSEKRSESIQLAQAGLKRVQLDLKTLDEERRNLLADAQKNHKNLKADIEDRPLRQLEKYKEALENFLTEQEKIDKTENDPQQKKWRSEIQNAMLLENELEFGKAIAIYERIQKEGYKDAKLDEHVARLHELWDLRDDKHKEARGFIYRIWPNLDTAHLEENIPKAQEAFKKCKEVDDRVSIKKLLKGTEGHADRLAKQLADLKPDLVIDDEKEAQQLKKLSEPIVKLGEEIQNYLKIHSDDK